MKSIILTVMVVIIGFAWGAKMIAADRQIRSEHPTAVFIKPYPRSLDGAIGPFEDGQTAVVEYDLLRADKPRSKVWLGNSRAYYMTIIKNGRFMDDIYDAHHCILAVGSYEIQVKDRLTNKIVSRVYFRGTSKSS